MENTENIVMEKPGRKDPKERFRKIYKEWILPFGLEIIVLFLLVKFVLFVAIVPSGSMIPTIAEKSAIFSVRVHNYDNLERGDVVVFYSDELSETLIKRLIGLPGDHVVIAEDGSMTINGESYPEDYVVNKSNMTGDFQVPEDCYLFLGDNRANSLDARYWYQPYIHQSDIQGKGVFTLFPFDHFGKLN